MRPTKGRSNRAREGALRRPTWSSVRHATGSLFPFASTVCGSPNSNAPRAAAGRPLADEDLARRSMLLESRADVDRVAGDERAVRRRVDDDVAGVDADPQLDLAVEELAEPVSHRQGRVQRALGVVLERGRRTERRHHRIAGELLERAAGQPHLLRHRLVEAVEQQPRALGILLAQLRRADEIGEEDGRDLPFHPAIVHHSARPTAGWGRWLWSNFLLGVGR